MSWLRLDDGFTKHPKFEGWPPAQRWAWLEVMEYCARYRTRGRIPADETLLPRSVTPELLARAESSRLCSRGADRALWIQDWEAYNPAGGSHNDGGLVPTDLDQRVERAVEEHPEASANELARIVGGRRKLALEAIRRFRAGSAAVPADGSGHQAGTGYARAHPVPSSSKTLKASRPSTSTEYAASPNGKPEEPNDPAAAEALEAPRRSEIVFACSTWIADVRQVEPLALALTRAEFEEVVAKVAQRCTTGHIGNPAGLLMQLLREAVARRERARTGPVTIATPAEQVITDAIAYAKGGHPLEVAVELIERKLARLGVPETDWQTLTATAMGAYTRTADEEPDLGLAGPPL